MEICLLDEEGLDLHTGNSSKPSNGQWMEKKREFEKKQDASVATQCKDNDVNAKVLQKKNCNRNKRVYECPVCLKQFGAPSKLKRHCLIHTDQRPYQCSICFRAFRERSHLNVHIKTHTNPSPDRVTPEKKETFPVSKSSDSIHMLQIKKKSGYQCEICLKKFIVPSKLTRHMCIHFDDKAYTCTICRKSFKQACYLQKHLKIHTGKRNTNAGMCRIPQKHGVKSSTPGVLQCMEDDGNVCLPQILDSLMDKKNEKTTFQSKLNQDTPLTESNSSTVEIKSSDTLKNAEVQISTSSSIDHKHTHKGVYKCSICLKNFLYPSKLTRHLQSHVRIHKRKVQNIIAGGLEPDRTVGAEDSDNVPKGQWKEETQTEEEQDVSVKTQNEDKFVNIKVLQSKKSNGSKRVYDCPVCHKGFGAPSRLKRHCLIHTNQRPFQCFICCRAFRERSHLKVHIRTHTNPVKSRTQPLQRYKDNSVPCNKTSKSTVQNSASLTENLQSTVHQKENMVTENVTSQIISGESNANLQDFLLNKDGLDLHTGLSYEYLSNPSEGKWIEEVQESDEEQEASVTTKSEDNVVIAKVLQSKNSGGNKRVYDCPVCHKQFGAPSKLKRHYLIHTNQRPFQCFLCCRAFRERSHLKVHIRTHTKPVKIKTRSLQSYKDNSVPCNQTSMSTEQETSAKIQSEDNNVNAKVLQSKNFNGSKRVYDCPVCHKSFGAPSKLKRHCLIHTNQRPFQCFICCRGFRERSHLKVHTRTHTNPVKSRTQPLQSCSKNRVPCNQTTVQPAVQNSASLTEKLQSTVHQQENMVIDKVASQSICGDCSESDEHLQDSLLNKGLDLHTGLSSAYSSYPPEGQWMEEVQESEEEQEANVTAKTEDSVVIAKVLQSKNSGGNKRVYDCPVCHKQFGAPSRLKRHCLIHTNQRPFQCFICCRAFRERSHLKVHIRTHTNPVKSRTQPLQSCRDNIVPCNKTSKLRLKPFRKQTTAQDYTKSTDSCVYLQDELNEGSWDIHTGLSSAYSSKPPEGQWKEEIQETEEEHEASAKTQNEDNNKKTIVLQSKNSSGNKRVYDCPVCHKRFGAPSKLKRHCLIHTNQRPFQCFICCRGFRERSNLKVHTRTHHAPGNQKTPSLQSYRDNNVSCNQVSKLKPSRKYLTGHNDTMSANKQKSTLQQNQNALTEDKSGDYSDSSVSLSKSASPLENVENKVGFSWNNKSVWGLTHKTDILLDGKRASDIVPFGWVSDCPPKTDSSLSHCASESRNEEKWAHHMDNIEDSVFLDSDSYKPTSCQYQQTNDVHKIAEIVVELEDFNDQDESFIKPAHGPSFCPDCNKSFRTVRGLYAHKCSNGYQEGEMKKSHQCDICFKLFNAPSKLKRHYITHTGQRPFQCIQCQKSFTQSHHLKTHMLSHR